MNKKDLFLEHLEYDFQKYSNQYESLVTEIEYLENTRPSVVSPQVIDSASWHESSLKDDYEKEKETKASERASRESKANALELKRWIEHGLFQRKLQFANNRNFYITTASVKRDYSFGNDFILSYWGDDTYRIPPLMQFEIGDISPKNGELIFVGDFKPIDRDLTNVRYKSEIGKQEFKSAKEIIYGQKQNVQFEQIKIDTSNFFRLKFELANIGDQSRALYDKHNAIIDGAAGTGKSTIALQKLKYLTLNDAVSQEECLVVVKNEQAIEHFKTLLKDEELSLDKIEIITLAECFRRFSLNYTISRDQLLTAKNNAEIINQEITDFILKPNQASLQSHFGSLAKHIGPQRLKDTLKTMLERISKDIDIQNKITDLDKQIAEISDSMIDDAVEDDEKLELIELLKNAKNRRNQISGQNYRKTLETIDSGIEKISIGVLTDIIEEDYAAKDVDQLGAMLLAKRHVTFFLDQEKAKKQLEIIVNQLTALESIQALSQKRDEIEIIIKTMEGHSEFDPKILSNQEKINYDKRKSILEQIKSYNDLLDKKKALEEKIIKKFEITKEERKNYEKVLSSLYRTNKFISETFLNSSSQEERYLTLQYLFSDDRPYNTMVVDEAQDYTLVELELLRLQTKRIILTGDLLQNIDEKKDFEMWEEILNFDDEYCIEDNLGEKKPNIFRLKHNFRQTYQLANASFNYRQLMINDENVLEDIQAEYYTSEKQFNGIPYRLPLVKFLEKYNFKSYLDSKIKEIANVYSSKIPIVVVYKGPEEEKFYSELLRGYKFTKFLDKDSINEHLDVLLVDIYDIKGKEFPIVFSNIDTLTNNEIYLIMTRAQFELEMISTVNTVSDNYLKRLEKHEWVKFEGYEIDTKHIRESLQEGQPKTIKSNKISSLSSSYIKDSETKKIEKPLVEKIDNHKASVVQKQEEISPPIVFDEEKYKNVFENKLIHQKGYVPKKRVVFVLKSYDNTEDDLHNEVKMFLYESYKGHCQICGFTFRKTNDQRNSFEKFNWSDKRIVKVEKKFISSADSLCLCRNCAANIKFGDFEPVFLDRINAIESLEDKDLEQIIPLIKSMAMVEDIHPVFLNHVLFDDLITLEIKLNKSTKNICFTKEHLLQFLIFVQMENTRSV